jgi:hypothetical protein
MSPSDCKLREIGLLTGDVALYPLSFSIVYCVSYALNTRPELAARYPGPMTRRTITGPAEPRAGFELLGEATDLEVAKSEFSKTFVALIDCCDPVT